MNIPNRHLLTLVSASCLLTVSGLRAAPNAEPVTVLSRGLNSRVVQNQAGGTYTVLADGLCYEENGVLKDSEDLIELGSQRGRKGVAKESQRSRKGVGPKYSQRGRSQVLTQRS